MPDDDLDFSSPEMMDYADRNDPCPVCDWQLEFRPIFAGCEDEEVYCPACGYVEGIA